MAPTRFSTGSTTSDSDNLHRLNVAANKNRPKPAPRRRPPSTRPRHMGTASLFRTKQPVASSSSPSSNEDLPSYCTTRVPRRQEPLINIAFPPPPASHTDYEDYRATGEISSKCARLTRPSTCSTDTRWMSTKCTSPLTGRTLWTMSPYNRRQPFKEAFFSEKNRNFF